MVVPLLDKPAVAPVQLHEKPPYSRQPSGTAVSFGHHHDAVADHAEGRFLGVLQPLLVDDPHVAADAGVLVDDRPFDVRAVAHAQRRVAVGVMGRDVVGGLVEVGPHQDRVANDHVAADAAAQPDHAVFDHRPRLDHRAVGHQAAADRGAVDPRGRQETGVGINRRLGRSHVERRIGPGQLEVRLVKRLDRADVFPIAVEQVNLHVPRADRRRKHLLAEVAVVGLVAARRPGRCG